MNRDLGEFLAEEVAVGSVPCRAGDGRSRGFYSDPVVGGPEVPAWWHAGQSRRVFSSNLHPSKSIDCP